MFDNLVPKRQNRINRFNKEFTGHRSWIVTNEESNNYTLIKQLPMQIETFTRINSHWGVEIKFNVKLHNKEFLLCTDNTSLICHGSRGLE